MNVKIISSFDTELLKKLALLNFRLINYEKRMCPYPEEEHFFTEKELFDRFLQWLSQGKLVLALLRETDPIGLATIQVVNNEKLSKKIVSILNFYVDENSRGIGAGSELYSFIERTYGAEGYINLNVLQENNLGRAFWESKGFTGYFLNLYKKVNP